jgi:hypothetical protein
MPVSRPCASTVPAQGETPQYVTCVSLPIRTEIISEMPCKALDVRQWQEQTFGKREISGKNNNGRGVFSLFMEGVHHEIKSLSQFIYCNSMDRRNQHCPF